MENREKAKTYISTSNNRIISSGGYVFADCYLFHPSPLFSISLFLVSFLLFAQPKHNQKKNRELLYSYI